MRLPIDTSGMQFLCAGVPEPVLDFETKRPRTDENGVPLYAVQLVAITNTGAEVITVRVPGQPTGIHQSSMVRAVGLVATPWSMGDRSGVSFRVTRLEPVSAPNGPAAGNTTAAGAKSQ